MANQVNWAAKSQEWSATLSSIYNSFPKLPDDLSGPEADRQQEKIDQYIQEFFGRETKQKEKCAKLFAELIPFVEHLIQTTNNPILRYKESQGSEPKKQVISFLDLVAKVQCINRAELSAFCTDPIYKGCVRIAYALDEIPFPDAAAFPQDADTADWMVPPLAHHVVNVIRAAAQPSQDTDANRRCQAIFRCVKTHMEQLRYYYELPALGQWSFYNACLAIFPYVTQDEEWAEKIQRLALARLSSDELNKVKTPGTTPTKPARQVSELNTPTRNTLVGASARLQAAIASESSTPSSALPGSSITVIDAKPSAVSIVSPPAAHAPVPAKLSAVSTASPVVASASPPVNAPVASVVPAGATQVPVAAAKAPARATSTAQQNSRKTTEETTLLDKEEEKCCTLM